MANLLLVTVTKVEANTVLELFSKYTAKAWSRKFINGKPYYSLGYLGGVDVFMVQSEMGSIGPGAAIITILRAIEDISPIAVIMVGIAFGVSSDYQKLGDILVSRHIRSYEQQKIKGKHIISRGDRVSASPKLLGLFKDGDLDWDQHPDRYGAKVHFGLIFSGEKLIMSRLFREQLLRIEPEAIGGEMEGAGLYTAASESKVDWILIKAICDWANEDRNYDTQPMAARNAVTFVIHVLMHGGIASIANERSIPIPISSPTSNAPSSLIDFEFPYSGDVSTKVSENQIINLYKDHFTDSENKVDKSHVQLYNIKTRNSYQNPSTPFLAQVLYDQTKGTLKSQEIIQIRSKYCYWGRGKNHEHLITYMKTKKMDLFNIKAILLPALFSAAGSVSPTAWMEIYDTFSLIYLGWGNRQAQENIIITNIKNDEFTISNKQPHILRGFEKIQFSGKPQVEYLYIPAIVEKKYMPLIKHIELMEALELWASAGYAWIQVGQKDRALAALENAVLIGLDNTISDQVLTTIYRLKNK